MYTFWLNGGLVFLIFTKTYYMNHENNLTTNQDKQDEQDENKEKQEPLRVHNPFDPNDKREITQEDIENEQKFKEALSERD